MTLLLAALLLPVIGGATALAASQWPKVAAGLGAAGTIAGCVLGMIPAIQVALGGEALALRASWDVPGGVFAVGLDALSAWFLIPTFLLSALAALYGHGYLLAHPGRRPAGVPWFFGGLLTSGMAMVILSRDGLLFLVAWEVMSLASYFLVTLEDEDDGARRAGFTYLVATHVGTAFLLAFFVLLGRAAGSLEFSAIQAAGPPDAVISGVLFVLALVGFGVKAGLVPFHVWLPEAHPAAPSHVSAVMSGVMIKTGVYGLLRALHFLHAPAAWWGWTLIGVGLASGLTGVLFALAQRDLKRILAYSSVENVGVVTTGIGVGILGLASSSSSMFVLGFAGALLHVLNHAVMKGLLFLGAGPVALHTGTRDIEQLGGLSKRMPWTTGFFLTGSLSISALPPFVGFTGELLILLGALEGVVSLEFTGAAVSVAAVAGIALIGGLTAACFTRAFGTTFLGEPRSIVDRHEVGPGDPGSGMKAAMAILAGLCLTGAFLAPLAIRPLVGSLAGLHPAPAADLDTAVKALGSVAALGAVLIALVAGLIVFRLRLLKGRRIDEAGTWACGYAAASARMQYTGGSFAQPLTSLFAPMLARRTSIEPPAGYFPRGASFESETPDIIGRLLYRPLFERLSASLARLRWLQHGQVRLYIAYIAATLLVLLVWKLR